MKTGKINYEKFGTTINGYLGEDGFQGDVDIKQPDGSFKWASGEFPRLEKIGEVEINFEEYV